MNHILSTEEFHIVLLFRGTDIIDIIPIGFIGKSLCRTNGLIFGIKGIVNCANAEILGLLEGKITCSQQLSLRASGKVIGDVHTKTLIVEPGALFNGTCAMGGEKAAPAK